MDDVDTRSHQVNRDQQVFDGGSVRAWSDSSFVGDSSSFLGECVAKNQYPVAAALVVDEYGDDLSPSGVGYEVRDGLHLEVVVLSGAEEVRVLE